MERLTSSIKNLLKNSSIKPGLKKLFVNSELLFNTECLINYSMSTKGKQCAMMTIMGARPQSSPLAMTSSYYVGLHYGTLSGCTG